MLKFQSAYKLLIKILASGYYSEACWERKGHYHHSHAEESLEACLPYLESEAKGQMLIQWSRWNKTNGGQFAQDITPKAASC